MSNPKPTYDVTNAEELNKFLMGTLKGIKTKEVSFEEADAISKISDKIIKNNLVRLMYKKMTKHDAPIEELEPIVNKSFLQAS